MAVILYQVGIFFAIQIAANYSRDSRNTALILISIFTILQVFMTWLLLLQFITIYLAYSYSETILERNNRKNNSKNISTQKTKNISYTSTPNPITVRSIQDLARYSLGKNLPKNFNLGSYGTKIENPILMSSINSSRQFLDKITNINDKLSYIKVRSGETILFKNPIDIYDFYKENDFLTKLYVYSYYTDNIELIPSQLQKDYKNIQNKNDNNDLDIEAIMNEVGI